MMGASHPIGGVQGSKDGRQDRSGRECDFCGDRVATVRRVALDREYDRLQRVHRELYACPACFEDKERQRLGLARR